ncbi:MAG: hypothetical protein AAF492_08035, partial [Verrucomicrobiota bacterium]
AFGRTWAYVFMSAPLIFIGCGLSDDEWPLWWLLNQRARQVAYLEPAKWRRPDTIVVTAEKDELKKRLKGNPAYIENLHFPSYGAMWDAIHCSLLRNERG